MLYELRKVFNKIPLKMFSNDNYFGQIPYGTSGPVFGLCQSQHKWKQTFERHGIQCVGRVGIGKSRNTGSQLQR